jgi:hypothetical protein
VDRVVGLEGVEFAMMETPDGYGRLKLIKFHAPPGRGGDRHAPANTPGIRHVCFAVDEIDAVVASFASPRQRSLASVALRRQLPALLRPRPGGDHRRTGGADRLMRRPADNRLASVSGRQGSELR